MPREVAVPITPTVLGWAMAESGYEPGSLGIALGVGADQIERWLGGGEKPLLSQFRDLARVLRRPTATFLLPGPPKVSRPPVAFRHPPGEAERELQKGEHLRIREVARLQRFLGWLVDEIGEAVQPLPQATTEEDPEQVGNRIRALLDVGLGVPSSQESEAAALLVWRRAMERVGILVFLLPMGKSAARGFSLFSERAPAIAVNTAWNTTARIFTLLHELAHLLTRTNSICSDAGHGTAATVDSDLERWCERTAAAALMPRRDVTSALRDWGNPPAGLATAGKLARHFKVSLRAAALRLVSLGLADWGLFAAIRTTSDAKVGGGGGNGRSRPKIRLDQYGRRPAQLVLKGMDKDVIGPSDAMSFLDLSYGNLEQLREML